MIGKSSLLHVKPGIYARIVEPFHFSDLCNVSNLCNNVIFLCYSIKTLLFKQLKRSLAENLI